MSQHQRTTALLTASMLFTARFSRLRVPIKGCLVYFEPFLASSSPSRNANLREILPVRSTSLSHTSGCFRHSYCRLPVGRHIVRKWEYSSEVCHCVGELCLNIHESAFTLLPNIISDSLTHFLEISQEDGPFVLYASFAIGWLWNCRQVSILTDAVEEDVPFVLFAVFESVSNRRSSEKQFASLSNYLQGPLALLQCLW